MRKKRTSEIRRFADLKTPPFLGVLLDLFSIVNAIEYWGQISGEFLDF